MLFDRLAYRFEIKSLNDAEPGKFAGRASVYGVVDAYDEVVLPGAFSKTLNDHGGQIVVLNQHNPSDPIGLATLTDGDDGLHCVGQLEMELPTAREAYTRLKSRLVSGISIGFQTVRDRMTAGGVRELLEIDLWEISLVTFPANAYARVTGVKALRRDLDQLIAMCDGQKEGRVLSTANRKMLADCAASMRAAVAQIDELILATAPEDAKAGGDEAARIVAPDSLRSISDLVADMRALLGVQRAA